MNPMSKCWLHRLANKSWNKKAGWNRRNDQMENQRTFARMDRVLRMGRALWSSILYRERIGYRVKGSIVGSGTHMAIKRCWNSNAFHFGGVKNCGILLSNTQIIDIDAVYILKYTHKYVYSVQKCILIHVCIYHPMSGVNRPLPTISPHPTPLVVLVRPGSFVCRGV